MSPINLAPDDVLDQVLEDELAATLQEFRAREDIAIDAVELADALPAENSRARCSNDAR